MGFYSEHPNLALILWLMNFEVQLNLNHKMQKALKPGNTLFSFRSYSNDIGFGNPPFSFKKTLLPACKPDCNRNTDRIINKNLFFILCLLFLGYYDTDQIKDITLI